MIDLRTLILIVLFASGLYGVFSSSRRYHEGRANYTTLSILILGGVCSLVGLLGLSLGLTR